jgi:Ser/Thr protein kinase RdoA (MazF antagonist)
MAPIETAHAALSKFTGYSPKIQLQRLERAGFSGCSLWKVSTTQGPLCLKCWPADNPPPARLPWIHTVINHARQQGLAFLPEFFTTREGLSTCAADGCTWELMTWLPGVADYWSQPSPQRLTAAFRALARFHQATFTRRLDLWSDPHYESDQRSNLQPAPAIVERLARLQELIDVGIEPIGLAVRQRRIPLIDDVAQQWLASRRLPPIDMLPRLMAAARQQYVMQPAIRDLWHDHVLFSGGEVTGFIDFGALRLDTPLVDLARLIGSLAGDDPMQRSLAIDSYAEIRQLSAADIALIDLLDQSGAWIAGWNWLDWLYREGREFPSLPAVRERLEHLLSRSLHGFIETRNAKNQTPRNEKPPTRPKLDRGFYG